MKEKRTVQETDKLVFVGFQTRCIATVGAANSRPKTLRFLSVSDKRKHIR